MKAKYRPITTTPVATINGAVISRVHIPRGRNYGAHYWESVQDFIDNDGTRHFGIRQFYHIEFPHGTNTNARTYRDAVRWASFPQLEAAALRAAIEKLESET